jgi:predicted Rossmann fold nucleotide-binding protein DprA/Smf involved in DNA uptake
VNVHRAQGDRDYPSVLQDRLGADAPACLYATGKVSILRHHLLGLVCSIRCPGNIILKTLDAVRVLRDAGVVVIGGFHSPMEKECLDILLRGKQPVILCPARALKGLRLTQGARQAWKDGRLLILSTFADSVRRTTSTLAVQRNNLVAALADAVWAPHAAPGGKTWQTVHGALERGQPVFTFDVTDNATLIDAGARPFVF